MKSCREQLASRPPAMCCLVLALASLVGAGASGQETKPNAPAPAQPAQAGPATTPPAGESGATTPAKTTSPAADPGDPLDHLPGETRPTVYLLEDKDGKTQAVPGFRYEDFIEAFNIKNGLNQQRQKPLYNIDRLEINGAIQGERAELTIVLSITLRDPQWIRIPLRLGGAVLREPANYEGQGSQLVHFEDDREGYVCWLKGDPAERHKVTLKVLTSVSHVAGETRLKLSVPRATVSQLKLSVPIEKAGARVIDGGELQDPGTSNKGKTDLTVQGVGGEFTIAWRPPAAAVAAVPIVLESTGALLARVDGRSVNTEARLTVRSFGGQFDTFRVRLPPEAELVSAVQAGITITPMTPEPRRKPNEPAGKVIEVKLDRKTTGPIELRLVTERPYNAAQAGESLELAGFEVLGAVRQWGHIAVEVVGNWQVVWGPRNNVRQVDELPEPLRRDDLTAGFEYNVQPSSLTARVVPQKTRVSVDPEYVMLVGADRVQLRGKLKYKVRGAKVRALDVELPGWIVDDVGPGTLVNPDAAIGTDEPTTSIPLSQPSSGDFELTIDAHREITKDTDRIDLEVPRPVAEAAGQALVVVVPADNVELNPQNDALIGLVGQSSKPQMKLPERQQDPLLFRCEANPAHFVASFRVHPKAVTVEAIGQADLGEQEIQVEERLIYQIAYEPVDKLLLHMPRSILVDKLQITLDGNRLTAAIQPDESEAEGSPSLIRVALPSPRIGRCELRISYAVAQERLLPATSVPVSLPLVMPAEGKLAYNQLTVGGRSGLSVTLRKGAWSVETQPRYPAVQPGELLVTSRQSATEAPLAVTLKERQLDESTIVERGWIQTWLLDGGIRQERAVYRFTTSAGQLQVTLPSGIVLADLKMRLDGKTVAPEVDRENQLTVRFRATTVAREHLLQLDYRFTPREHGSSIDLTAAEFKSGVWVRRLYWQLIVPQKEHLLFSSGDYTREFNWVWDGLGYRRQPTLEQADLETWIGVSPGDLPPSAVNRYLFSSVGPQTELNAYVVRRSALVFGASLVLLLIAFAAIYVPVVRHPLVLLAAGLALFAGSLIEPEAALLFLQAAALGGGLALVAALLARRVRRRLMPPVTVIRSSSSILDRSLTQSMPRPIRTNQPSTATAALVMHGASPEAKP